MRAPWLALCLGLVGSLLSGCESQQEPPSRFRSAYHLGDYEANLGYSQSIKIGKTIYISMTLPVDKEGKLIAPDDMAGQLAAVYTNLGTTLKINGADFEHVAIERIYTTDMPGFLKYADQRLKIYSGESAPAASFIEVKHLADPGFLVGIEVVAELP
jgi:enamine deaminase RidA (YjgF/YER057c/UK114 family)